MSTSMEPFTADQLAALADDGHRYALVRGELRMMSPSGWRHGEIVGQLHGLLWRHVRGGLGGKLFGAESGFLIARDPDTVRGPDVAYIAREHVPAVEPPTSFWPGPPDLAIEVVSPNDRPSEISEKVRDWLAAGAREVWVIDPGQKTVAVHRAGNDVEILGRDQSLEGGDVVPGFRCRVDEIFHF